MGVEVGVGVGGGGGVHSVDLLFKCAHFQEQGTCPFIPF